MILPQSFSVGAFPALTQDAIARIQGVDLSKADLSVLARPQINAAFNEANLLTDSFWASSDFYSPKRINNEVTSVVRQLGPLQTPTTAGQLVAADPLPQAPTANEILSITTSAFDTINNPAFGAGFATNFIPVAPDALGPAIPDIGTLTQPLQAIAAVTLAPIGNPTQSPLLANFVPSVNPTLLPSGTFPAGATIPQPGQQAPLTQDPSATMRQTDINPALLGTTAGTVTVLNPVSTTTTAVINPALIGQIAGSGPSVPTAFVVNSNGVLQPVTLNAGVNPALLGQVQTGQIQTGATQVFPVLSSGISSPVPTAVAGLPVTANGTGQSFVTAAPLLGTNGLLPTQFINGNSPANPLIGLQPVSSVPQINASPIGNSPTATTVLASITNFIDQLLFRQPTFQPGPGNLVVASPFGGITILNPQEPQSAGTTLAFPQPFDTTFAQTGPLTAGFAPFATAGTLGLTTPMTLQANGTRSNTSPFVVGTGFTTPATLTGIGFSTPATVPGNGSLTSSGPFLPGTGFTTPTTLTGTPLTTPVTIQGNGSLTSSGPFLPGTGFTTPTTLTGTPLTTTLSVQGSTVGRVPVLSGQSVATLNNPIVARTGNLTFGVQWTL